MVASVPVGDISEKDARRFWRHVDKSSPPCWQWTKSTRAAGYGRIKIKGRWLSTHRVAYTLTKGCIPVGLLVMHTCDNPACVNPSHLRVGTHSDNLSDMHKKNRHPRPRGERHGRHILKESDALEILHLYNNGTNRNDIASKFGVCRGTANSIGRRITWRHLRADSQVPRP